MDRIRKIQYIALIFLFLKTTYAQEPLEIVKHYDIPFSSGMAWSFAQDSLGYLYFGMIGGVAVYDGNKWEFIKTGSETTRSLFVDAENNLWYGAVNDFGRIEKSRERGIYFESSTAILPERIKTFGDIWSINEVSGNIFFQARNYIFVYNPDQELTSYEVDDSYHRAISTDSLFIINQKNIGLCVFNGSGFVPMIGGDFFKDKLISGSLSLKSDTLLIGTRSSGVYKYNIKTGAVVSGFKNQEVTINFLIKNKLYDMVQLPEGEIAFATLLKGSIITDSEGRILKYLNNQSGVSDNKHYAIQLSQNQNLWMCNQLGCDVFNINSPLILWDKQVGISGSIVDIAKCDNGILAGGADGLYFISDPDYLNHHRNEKLLSTEIWDLCKFEKIGVENSVFIGSSDGLYLFGNGTMKHIYPNELILNMIQLNANNNILLAFTAQSILLFNTSDNRITYLGEISGLFNVLSSVSQTGNKFIWLGTRSNLLIRIEQEEIIKWLNNRNIALSRKEFKVDKITDVIKYGQQTFFTNEYGVFDYDEKLGTLARTRAFGDDIYLLRERITDLEADSHGNIWLGGNRILLNTQDGSYSLHYLTYENIKNINLANAFLHVNDKTWIGGAKGLYLLDRSKLVTKKNDQSVIINRILIKDSVQYIFENKSSNEILPIEKGADFTIYYSFPNYNNDSKIEYSFFLDGYSSIWSNWSEEQYTTFTNLNPGSYNFRVKAKYENINETPITSYGIFIEKPWYLTNLAIVSSILLATFSLYLLVRLYINIRVKIGLRFERIIQSRLHEKYFLHYYANSEEFPEIKEEDTKDIVQIKDKLIKDRHSKFLDNILNIIDENIEDSSFNVTKLCNLMNLSQTMLYRNVRASTGLSISSFIRKVRLKKAMQLLVNTNLNVSEVAYKSGFNDPGYFTKCFTNEFGMSPRSFQRFNS